MMRGIILLSALFASAISAKIFAHDRAHAQEMAYQWHTTLMASAGIASSAAIVGITDASIKGFGRIPFASAGVAAVALPLYVRAVKEYRYWNARAQA